MCLRRTLERAGMSNTAIYWIRQSNLIEGVDDPSEDKRSLRAWNWLNKQHLCCCTILKLHRKIMLKKLIHKELGKWRKQPVWVGGREGANWKSIPELIHKWLVSYRDLTEKDHAIDAHIAFEKIHPFIDGNGRVGRMIMNLQVVRLGLEPICIEYSKRWDYYEWFI